MRVVQIVATDIDGAVLAQGGEILGRVLVREGVDVQRV